jgi:hypothetical protein
MSTPSCHDAPKNVQTSLLGSISYQESQTKHSDVSKATS